MSRVFKVDYIPDPDRGRPLWNAKIFVGVANQDPTIPSNQIQLTGDIGFPVGQSIPVPQPVRTNAGGITVYNNSPLDLNAPGQEYAIQIFDRNDNLIYNFPQVDGSVVMNTTSQEEVTGLTIWPEVGEAVIGQTIPAGTDAIRYPFNGRSTLFTVKPPVAVTGTITNITINSSGIGELEVDNSDVYDLAEFNSFIAANDGDSQLAGGPIWPLSSQNVVSTGGPFNSIPSGTEFINVQGGIFTDIATVDFVPKDFTSAKPSGTITALDLSRNPIPQITIGGVECWILNRIENTKDRKELGVFFLIGDGSDESDALEIALNYNRKLLAGEGKDYGYTRQLDIDTSLDLVIDGTITCNADVEFGLFQDSQLFFKVSGTGVHRTIFPYASMTLLNRGFRQENCAYSEVSGIEMEGWRTATHSLLGGYNYVHDIRLTNIYGTEPQEGYGVNSSADIFIVNNVVWDNTSISGEGRHVVYVNGPTRVCSVNDISIDFCYRNPINIGITDTVEGQLTVSNIKANDCLVAPLSNTTGLVNVSAPGAGTGPEKVSASVKDVKALRCAGSVVSFPSGGYSGATVTDINQIDAITDVNATYSGFGIVNMRNTSDIVVNDVYSNGFPDSNSRGLIIREVQGTSLDNLTIIGTTGDAAVRLEDSSDLRVGTVKHELSTFIDEVGTTSDIRLSAYYNTTTRQVNIVGNNIDASDNDVIFTTDTGDVNTMDGTRDGQLVTLVAQNAGVTIKNLTAGSGAQIETKTGADVPLGVRGTIQFVRRGSIWLEV